MRTTRRNFTLGSLLAAGTLGMPVFVKAQQGKTVALLFDSLVSPFWVSGLEIMRTKAKENGWEVLENISNFDDNKQFEQVKAMIARKVDGILIIQTDSKAVIPAIRAANEAGIPMVHFNRPPAESDAYSVAIQADKVTTLIRVVNDSYFVAFSMSPGANIGKARYMLRTRVPLLLKELS